MAKPIPPGGLQAPASAASDGPDLGEQLVRGDASTPQRGPDGKFVKGGGGSTPPAAADNPPAAATGNDTDPNAQPQAQAQAQAQGTAPPVSRRGHTKPYVAQDGSIVIAGKTFKDLDQLQQVLLSKGGEAAAASRQLAELQASHDKLRTDYISAVNVADQWAQHAQQQGGQGGGQPAQAQPPGAAPAQAPDATQTPTANFNPATFRVLLEKHGVDEAMLYLTQAQAKDYEARETALTEKLTQAFTERLGPLEQYSTAMRNLQLAGGFLQKAATLTDAAGNPRYPELSDPAARAGILSTWRGLPQEFMYDKDLRGIEYAVLAHRHSAGEETQRADGSDLDLFAGLDLADAPVTLEGGAGGNLPRPGEGGNNSADLAEQLIGSSAGTGDGETDTSFMPTP